MCGRFSQERPASELAEIFAAEPLADELGPRWNVAPTDEAFVVVQRDDRRAITAYRWGLIPHWAESPRIASRTFNARAETIAVNASFRDAFRRKRCLVPVDGFYEWHRVDGRRQPYAIARRDRRPLALAGLWAGWRDPAADRVVRTFTIVTTAPNAQLGWLHDRMPVVVPEEAWDRWLDPALADPGELHGLLEPSDEIELATWPVSDLVNNVRNDGPELVREVDPDELVSASPSPRVPGLFDGLA
jgi:putative SOS response-associated peptidase YedK